MAKNLHKNRICSRCKIEKHPDEFNWKVLDKKKMSWCRQCESDYKLQYKNQNLDKIRKQARLRVQKQQEIYDNTVKPLLYDYLSEHPCVDCGEKDIVVLEFDHVTGIKESTIARLLASRRPWETISKEIEKCVVRCANCHRRKTAKERGYAKHKLYTTSED